MGVNRNGSISAPDEGNTEVLITGNNANVRNSGQLSGGINGISSVGDSFTLNNQRNGVISYDSRALDITDGDNITANNAGTI